MRIFWALLKRELRSVFVSPLAYGAGALFLFLVGLVFCGQFLRTHQVDPRTVLDPLGFILAVLLSPLLTMRLLAEERRQGTLEMLVTAPVTETQVALSKFAGVLLYSLSLAALTGLHLAAMALFHEGSLDLGRFAAAYLGLALINGFFLALGLFFSSLFESPVLAGLVGLVAGLFVFFAGFLTGSPLFLQGGIAYRIVEFLLPAPHYAPFLRGLVQSGDLAYFLSFITYFLFLTIKSMELRKWH